MKAASGSISDARCPAPPRVPHLSARGSGKVGGSGPGQMWKSESGYITWASRGRAGRDRGPQGSSKLDSRLASRPAPPSPARRAKTTTSHQPSSQHPSGASAGPRPSRPCPSRPRGHTALRPCPAPEKVRPKSETARAAALISAYADGRGADNARGLPDAGRGRCTANSRVEAADCGRRDFEAARRNRDVPPANEPEPRAARAARALSLGGEARESSCCTRGGPTPLGLPLGPGGAAGRYGGGSRRPETRTVSPSEKISSEDLRPPNTIQYRGAGRGDKRGNRWGWVRPGLRCAVRDKPQPARPWPGRA